MFHDQLESSVVEMRSDIKHAYTFVRCVAKVRQSIRQSCTMLSVDQLQLISDADMMCFFLASSILSSASASVTVILLRGKDSELRNERSTQHWQI
jgi:hypothetical protein